jgi:amino acid transporter
VQSDDTLDLRSPRQNAIEFVPVIFQSVTTLGPVASVASALLIGTLYARSAAPLAFLIFSIIAYPLVAISIDQLGRHLPPAGGLYTYTANGLEPMAGLLVGRSIISMYTCSPTFYWGFVGILALDKVKVIGLGGPTDRWIPLAIVATAIVWVFVRRGIDVSTTLGVELGVTELGIFVTLSLWLIVFARTTTRWMHLRSATTIDTAWVQCLQP